MQNFSIEKTKLKGISLIHSFCSEDERGRVVKDFSDEMYSENQIEFSVFESLQIFSKKRTLRGLHIQKNGGQSKLIQCVFGKVCVAIVDLRKESEQFGQNILLELNGMDGISILIPPQFALGTLAMDDSIISCKCDKEYLSEYDTGIIWNDKKVNIPWPIDMIDFPIISDKDKLWGNCEEYRRCI